MKRELFAADHKWINKVQEYNIDVQHGETSPVHEEELAKRGWTTMEITVNITTSDPPKFV